MDGAGGYTHIAIIATSSRVLKWDWKVSLSIRTRFSMHYALVIFYHTKHMPYVIWQVSTKNDVRLQWQMNQDVMWCQPCHSLSKVRTIYSIDAECLQLLSWRVDSWQLSNTHTLLWHSYSNSTSNKNHDSCVYISHQNIAIVTLVDIHCIICCD